MKLKWTYAAFLVVVTVVLGGAVVSGFALYEDTVRDNARESVTRAAYTKATQIDAVLTERTRTIQLQARDPALLGPSDERRESLERFVSTTTFQGVSVIAANGTMIAIEAEGLSERVRSELIGSDFSHRAYFRAAMAGERYVSEPVEAESGNYIVTVSVPVERDGDVVATLNAALHLQNGRSFFEQIAPRDDATAVRVTAGETVVHESGTWSRDEMIVDQATVATTNWTVTVAKPRAVVSAPARTALLFQTGAALLVLVTLAGFGGWFYRSSIQQINELLQGFDRLAERQWNLDISLTGGDEWDSIERRFNEVSAELERQTRQLSVLDRVLRHNLRNDMTVIKGHAELIRDTATGDAKAYADTVVSKTDQLLDRVDKQRELTKLFADPHSVDVLDLVPVIRSSVEHVRKRHPNADVSVSIPESMPVRATSNVGMAVEELLCNAATHSDRDAPHIDVQLRAAGGQAVLRIADDGSGIPEMERRVLTGERAIEPLYHGTGLGLWLVKTIVSQSKGELAFDENDPRGSVVTIRLDGDVTADAE
jgi:signal transduction histidine kinase